MRRLSAIFAVAALAAGCTAAQLHYRALEAQASVDLRCTDETLRIRDTGMHTARVEGCGGRATYIFDKETKTWALEARAHHVTLRSRASFDLRCPSAQLNVTEIDLRTAGVEGCDRRATYLFDEEARTWVMNTPPADPAPPGMAAGPPPPPPPPPASAAH